MCASSVSASLATVSGEEYDLRLSDESGDAFDLSKLDGNKTESDFHHQSQPTSTSVLLEQQKLSTLLTIQSLKATKNNQTLCFRNTIN